MNKATLAALNGSIAKWQRIAAGIGVDYGIANCPLCQLFINIDYSGCIDCSGCPVAAKTGTIECGDTPYEAWCDATRMMYVRRANTPERKKLARAELAFLKSLLPRKRK